MKKYYIGFFALLAICLGVLIYAVGQGGNAKIDSKTDDAVNQISEKLTIYSYDHGAPSSLSEAGINNLPDTVKYTKLSNDKYKICFDYKAASSGFDASWTGLLLGGLSAGSSYDYNQQNDGSYFDSSVESNHKKGQNCQTVNSNINNYNSLYNDTGNQSSSQGDLIPEGCSDGPGTVYYHYRLYAQISSIDTTNLKIYLVTSSSQVLYDGLLSGSTLSDPLEYLTYSSGTKVYDSSCKKISVSMLPTFRPIYFYMTSKETKFASEITAQDFATQTPMPSTGCEQSGSTYICNP